MTYFRTPWVSFFALLLFSLPGWGETTSSIVRISTGQVQLRVVPLADLQYLGETTLHPPLKIIPEQVKSGDEAFRLSQSSAIMLSWTLRSDAHFQPFELMVATTGINLNLDGDRKFKTYSKDNLVVTYKDHLVTSTHTAYFDLTTGPDNFYKGGLTFRLTGVTSIIVYFSNLPAFTKVDLDTVLDPFKKKSLTRLNDVLNP